MELKLGNTLSLFLINGRRRVIIDHHGLFQNGDFGLAKPCCQLRGKFRFKRHPQLVDIAD